MIVTVSFIFQTFCLAQTAEPSANAITTMQQLRPAEQQKKWGYVNPVGKFAIPPQFESAGPFSEGVAAVEVEGRFGYIAPDGHVVIEPKYFWAGPFSDGHAWVLTSKPRAPLGTGEYGIVLFGRFTFIDHSGREVRAPFWAEHISSFSEGLAAVRPGKIYGGCSEKVGYLNTKGEWRIKPQFDDARDFTDGLAPVNRGGKCYAGGKWGYIDTDDTLAIPFQYDYATTFSNGHACVREAAQWKIIDKTGQGSPVTERECFEQLGKSP
jgi:hypothetical protein